MSGSYAVGTPAGPSEEPTFACPTEDSPRLVNVSYQTETPNVLQPCLGEYGALSCFPSSLDLPNLLLSGAQKKGVRQGEIFRARDSCSQSQVLEPEVKPVLEEY